MIIVIVDAAKVEFLIKTPLDNNAPFFCKLSFDQRPKLIIYINKRTDLMTT